MIIFQIQDHKKGEQTPHREPRSFYKAYLNHINCRRDHNTKVRVSRRSVGHDIIITAHVMTLDHAMPKKEQIIDLDDLFAEVA